MRVVVGGAGLAGLCAARALEQRGVEVVVIEARDRVGGRVWTMRDGFAQGQRAEAGADLIETNQKAVLGLARELGLRTVPVLRRGFAFFTVDARGRIVRRKIDRGLQDIEKHLAPLVRDYALTEQDWSGPIAQRLARQSVASWLDAIRAPVAVKTRVRGLRGLFLADPEELSLLAFVDFFSDLEEQGGWSPMRRVLGGNDRIATTMVRRLHGEVRLRTVVRRVVTREHGVCVAVENASGLAELHADFFVSALPATTLRDVQFEPGLPDAQRETIARLRYGSATRLVLQFERPFWRKRDRPSAFGTDQPTGAFWDASEEQKGRGALLSFLAGGSASASLRAVLASEGIDGVVRRLRWLGRPTPVIASQTHVWEDDLWSRGGYAFFDPSFDPERRTWLARPAGRVVFAGEHTSHRWQGYMSGAIESGQRAAAEVAVMRD